MNVKVDAELVRKAKVVAAARRITLSDYVSDLLRPLVEVDLARVAAGLMRPAEEAAASPGETPSATA
jgi:hypothetical protein